MAYGQKYQDLPFDERFGNWQEDQVLGHEDIRQQAIERLLEEFNKQRQQERPLERTWPYGYVRV